MRLAVHTYSFRSVDLAAALAAARRLDVDAVELWLGHADSLAKAVDAVERSGLDVAAVGGVGVYAPADLVQVDRALTLAQAVGATAVVGCALPSLLPEVVGRMPPELTFAAENHWDQPLSSPRRVLEATSRAGCGACLDTGHALLAGVEPERFAAALDSRLHHVHLKDARRATPAERLLGRRGWRRVLPRPAPVRPGEGALAVERLAAQLRAQAYERTVTAEFEGPDPEQALGTLVRRWRSASAPARG